MTYIRNRYFLFTDVILLVFASYASYVLRLETFDSTAILTQHSFILFTVMAVVIVPLVFWQSGIYSHYWRYASVEEVFLLIGAVTFSAILTGGMSIFAMTMVPHQQPIPRSVPFIFLLLALGVTSGPRLFVRFVMRHQQHLLAQEGVKPVIIMGAGEAGALIVREIRRNPQLGMDVVGFLDDDQAKQRMRIHGVPVLGTRHDIPEIVQQYRVQQVIIAMPAAPGKAIRDIVKLCEQTGVQTKTIPGIYELLRDRAQVSQLRNVQIEDLLRREPVQTDIAAVQELIRDKRVLVTGGGGSIGSELCRQILRCQPQALILLGHGENSIFEIGNELQQTLREVWRDKSIGRMPPVLHQMIADIRLKDRIQSIFEEHHPDVVFHAAAHKHVPLMEMNPAEAVTNNILGTRNLLEASLAVDVERFVMISTDKAVNPTSIMGTTKRVAELLVHQTAMRTGKRYAAVRFGNVLGSRGSVILTFKKQIAAGGPVTVTHPEITRYFMTIPEAVQLVLQAAVLGEPGKIFMLDMGEPVKIVDLARDMIELSGLEVGEDIDIVFTGLRPGEKLYEELFIAGEEYQPTCHEKIAIAINASTKESPHLDETIAELEQVVQYNDRERIVQLLKTLVPEYHPPQQYSISLQSRTLVV